MSSLKSKIESLLFISAKPMSVKQLGDLTKKKSDEIKKAGDDLVSDYKEKKSGIQIIKNASKYQMVSSPENAKLVQEFIKDETTGELSRPSLETLTIIAYKGPISKVELNQIRGVNCALILRNLLLRGLIEIKNVKSQNEEENEIVEATYSVTFDFMRHLGINDVKELPDFEKLSNDGSVNQILNKEEESGDKTVASKENVPEEKEDASNEEIREEESK